MSYSSQTVSGCQPQHPPWQTCETKLMGFVMTFQFRAEPNELDPFPAAARQSSAFATEPTNPYAPRPSLKLAGISSGNPLPYFHVKLYSVWRSRQTIYRVYLTEHDFLFIHLGIRTLHPEQDLGPTPVIPNAGIFVALVIAAYVRCKAAMERQQLDHLTKALDAADEEVLREFVAEDKDSFILPYDDVQNVHLEPRTFWGSLMCRDLLAFLQWSSATRGEMTMSLIASNEMTQVVEEMRRIFGEVRCNLSWRSF